MERSKFTESQIIFALRQAETGVKVSEVYRKMGISEAFDDFTYLTPPTEVFGKVITGFAIKKQD